MFQTYLANTTVHATDWLKFSLGIMLCEHDEPNYQWGMIF